MFSTKSIVQKDENLSLLVQFDSPFGKAIAENRYTTDVSCMLNSLMKMKMWSVALYSTLFWLPSRTLHCISRFAPIGIICMIMIRQIFEFTWGMVGEIVQRYTFRRAVAGGKFDYLCPRHLYIRVYIWCTTVKWLTGYKFCTFRFSFFY